MNKPNDSPRPITFIRELCKHKTETEILEAEATFRKFLLIVSEICDNETAEEALLDKE